MTMPISDMPPRQKKRVGQAGVQTTERYAARRRREAQDKSAQILAHYMDLESSDIIKAVRDGVPADFIDELGQAMSVSRTQLLDWMGLPETTVKRKIRSAQPLSKAVSEQAVAMARLIGQVQRMVNESGDPEGFDAAVWLAEWLAEPNPALGGVPPGEYMDTAEGFNLVSDTLARMQTGAYA